MTSMGALTGARTTLGGRAIRMTKQRYPLASAVVFCLLLCSGSAKGESARAKNQLSDDPPKRENALANAAMPAASAKPPIPEDVKKEEIDPTAYIIGEQDSLVITVWKEKDISGGAVVRPDGKITVPLVGEIKVVGMTPVQLQTLLAEKLKPFVTVPQVTVAVAEIRSRKVYLIGHAAREGPF